MFSICETQNFLWSTRDILGKGATATVYRGLNKSNGDPVAVKCYSDRFTRPETQFREYEVLKKLNNENIVKLLAIEENLKDGKNVIIMEFCNGGSLLTNLLEPENAYGLGESEFVLVLRHLCDGLKYLRDNSISHRDLKPGNIMKCIKEDGTIIYKLADFGAARELKDEETFQSICGTEVYLHPGLFEKIILGRKPHGQFYPSTDLWSVGVTLYHIATGMLPFRVYSSYKNKETLHHIMTKKSSGVISGVQIQNNGPIIWSEKLPDTCLLSSGMKKGVEVVIAGLLEDDRDRMWGFDKFFTEVDNLLSQIPVNVFYVNKARLIKLYMPPDQKYKDFQRCIKTQTEVEEIDQILFYKNNYFSHYVQGVAKIDDFPETSETHPIFLFNKAKEVFPLRSIEIPEWEDFAVNISIENDTPTAKNACIIAHHCKRQIDRYSHYCYLLEDSINIFIDFLDKDIKDMQLKSQHLYEKLCILKKPANLLDLLQKINANAGKRDCYSRLNCTAKEFATGTAIEVTNLYNKECVENTLKTSWNDMTGNVRDCFKNRVSARAHTQVEELKESWIRLTSQRENQNLSYNGGHWHILERKKIRQRLDNVIIFLKGEAFYQYQEMAQCFENWYESSREMHRQISSLKLEIKHFEENLKKFDTEFTENLDICVKTNKRPPRTATSTKTASSEDFRKRWTEYYNNKTNFSEILSENHRLMTQIQEFTKNLKL